MINFLHGFWTTLDLPDLNHDLAVLLSEVHMAYCGLCKYSYLCHTIDLPTKGKKVLKHKLEKTKLITTKHLKIKLTRVEEFNNTAVSLLNTTSRILGNVTPVSHECYVHMSKELNVNNLNKDISSKEGPTSLLNIESSNTRNATPLVLKEVTPESNIVSVTNSFAATASTKTRNATFKTVHSDLLHKMFISNMKMSQLRYHTVQCSKITTVYQYSQISNKTVKTYKTAGAVILQLALKLQKGNNFSVIPI